MSLITGIHHTTLEIPFGGEDQARQFYGQILGLPEIAIPLSLRGHEGGSVWFRLNGAGQQLHLGPVADFQPPRRAHSAFQVSNFAEFQCAMEQAGIPLQAAVVEPGWARCYLRDPFGNKLEVRQLLEEEEHA